MKFCYNKYNCKFFACWHWPSRWLLFLVIFCSLNPLFSVDILSEVFIVHYFNLNYTLQVYLWSFKLRQFSQNTNWKFRSNTNKICELIKPLHIQKTSFFVIFFVIFCSQSHCSRVSRNLDISLFLYNLYVTSVFMKFCYNKYKLWIFVFVDIGHPSNYYF